MDKYVIEVNDVSMKYRIYKEKIDSFKEYFIKLVKKQVSWEEFYALQNISFSVESGDVLGIVGLNGSGKSTLLKILSHVLKPTTGSVSVNGSVAPLIELGAGFDPNLSATENIYLNASILGYSKEYITEKFDEIIDFSELHQFVDVPIKSFSTGMVARLAFAIATSIKPDILIVDEILSVGDYMFKEKSEKRMNSLMSGGTTVVLVSHSSDQIKKICNKAIWLEKGIIMKKGPVKEVVDAYLAGGKEN